MNLLKKAMTNWQMPFHHTTKGNSKTKVHFLPVTTYSSAGLGRACSWSTTNSTSNCGKSTKTKTQCWSAVRAMKAGMKTPK